MLDQDSSFYLISLNIFITFLLNSAWILQGKVSCWSHLGVKGLNWPKHISGYRSFHFWYSALQSGNYVSKILESIFVKLCTIRLCSAILWNDPFCVSRRDKLWIAMEFCGAGSAQDIYCGQYNYEFTFKSCTYQLHLASFSWLKNHILIRSRHRNL